jgi:DnaJ-class molecular chaperone
VKGFIFSVRDSCETCEGEGFIVTGQKAGFSVKRMEVTMEDDGHRCPECYERSMADYEDYCEREMDDRREA